MFKEKEVITSIEQLSEITNPLTMFWSLFKYSWIISDSINSLISEVSNIGDWTRSTLNWLLYDMKINEKNISISVIDRKDWKKKEIKRWILEEYPNYDSLNKKDQYNAIIIFYKKNGEFLNLEIKETESGITVWYTNEFIEDMKENEYSYKKTLETITDKWFLWAIKKGIKIEDEKYILLQEINKIFTVKTSNIKKVENNKPIQLILDKYINEKIKEEEKKEIQKFYNKKNLEVDPKIKEYIKLKKLKDSIISITTSLLSPVFMGFLISKISKKLYSNEENIKNVEYIMTYHFANNYDEYLSIKKFFIQLRHSMSDDFLKKYFKWVWRYFFWVLFLGFSLFLLPAIISGAIILFFTFYIIKNTDIVRKTFLSWNFGPTLFLAFGIAISIVLGTVFTQYDFYKIKYHENKEFINKISIGSILDMDWDNFSMDIVNGLTWDDKKSINCLDKNYQLNSTSCVEDLDDR